MKKHSKKAAAGSKPSRTVGLDLGDKFCHYCILDGEGEVMEEGRVKTEEGALRKHFENEERMRVAMECGTHSPWISRLLAKLGHEVIVANARKLKAVTQEEVETIAGIPNNWRNSPIGVRRFKRESNTAVPSGNGI